jgi:GH18 family chitinase
MPSEHRSLADDPSHQAILEELRERLDGHMEQTGAAVTSRC